MSETISLKYPLTVDGGKVTELNFRRPKVKDMLVVDKITGTTAKNIMLFANLTGLTPADIESLDMADFSQLSEVFNDFLS